MSDDSLMYVISSRDGFSSTTTAHDLSISLNGMPTKYRKFKCEVKSFSLNVNSMTTAFKDIQSQVFLSSNNFISSGLENSNSDIPNIVAYCDTISGTNNQVAVEFIIPNKNGNIVRFTLLDTIFSGVAGTDINQGGINTAWTLILKLTGIKD
jgi:hypothetical protein